MDVYTRLQRLFYDPGRADLVHFLRSRDPDESERMYAFADRLRREYVGDAIHLRAIIEFSNFCRNDCLYCGLRRSNLSLRRLRMSAEKIIAQCRRAAGLGFRTVVLQSGEDPHYSRQTIVEIIQTVKRETGLAITLAIGEKSEAEYQSYFKAGADRFLLKHETSDREVYERLDPGLSYDRRLACLKALKKIGYQAGSGIMIGLPGQTLESIAADILLFRELDIDMIGSGPFIPHPHTPLARAAPGSEELTYRVVALCRIVTRDTHIPATTALAVLRGERARENALCRGANVVMPNITPQPYRRCYDIYPSKGRAEVFNGAMLRRLEKTALELGRFIAADAGHRVKRMQGNLTLTGKE
jgi:biotin synthase